MLKQHPGSGTPLHWDDLFLLCLDKTSLDDASPHLDFEEIASESRVRAGRAWKELTKRFIRRKLRMALPSYYALDGSLKIGPVEFEKFAPEFFRRSRRTIWFRGQHHLRGGSYLVSGNPTFELRPKLDTFREDLEEALEALPTTHMTFFQVAIADYVKNSAITMLNSYLQEEKVGKYRFDQIGY